MLDLAALARTHQIEIERLRAALAELFDHGLIVETDQADSHIPRRELTNEGCNVFDRLVAARRDHLAEVWAEWSPEKRTELAETLRRVARELVPEAQPAALR